MAGALTISTLNNDTGVLATQNGMTGIAKAWVNFDGAGTINAAFNVSSVTKNATGNYTVNFTTAMPNANYSIAANARRPSSNADFALTPRGSADTGGILYSTTQCAFISHTCTGYTISDVDIGCVQVFSS
jgi:hypothetical protein